MIDLTKAPFCIQCGTRLEPRVAFCTACGAAAGVTEPATTSAAAGPAHPLPPTQVEHSSIREPTVRHPVEPQPAAAVWRAEPGSGWAEPGFADTGRPPRGPRSGLLTAGVILLVLAVVAAAVAFVAMRRTSSGSSNATSSSSTVQPGTSGAPAPSYAPGPSYAPVPASDLPTQAGAVDALLSMSVSSRAAVVQAAAQIGACTSLAGAKSAMTAAATTRETAANNAATLPVSALPNGSGVISLLVNMMQASATADRGYAAWADDVAAGGCRGGSATHTANFTAAEAASSQATALKQQFAAAWNPIATQAGLPTRTADQL
jgi:hypothetical protein